MMSRFAYQGNLRHIDSTSNHFETLMWRQHFMNIGLKPLALKKRDNNQILPFIPALQNNRASFAVS
ncbi:hypothetical protein GUITHDRAFT_150791 [Guillardia theta CCMP2712]|uniref:Uncharacterized protein n=1 Tax=Guillardia theta (strain CCMP2712) TaxID=905079 RepID=L1JTU9_GUITC|nr:hypothetical protein GUITHDRAFT_150791 [Guillardia theta CCMP2712]EKX51739.1 hypothetical protein GUITHDRAFT_150791 [Guillardia theta CCMP2712]|eukprot:XP_005838719.1 hypothetical protein GUITHDRAFT_150791 [Guillardia theta CCMP2712]